MAVLAREVERAASSEARAVVFEALVAAEDSCLAHISCIRIIVSGAAQRFGRGQDPLGRDEVRLGFRRLVERHRRGLLHVIRNVQPLFEDCRPDRGGEEGYRFTGAES